ncbi:calcium-binding protein [Sulfitobacter undariae]|nr:calcium-binding protein [Sulfitobacter undariae]
MFNNFMESQNLDVQADAQVINGASLRYNWDNGASAQGVNAREVLPSGDYDTVIVTEAIPLDAQIQWNDTQGYAKRYFDLAQSADTETRFFLYETWHGLGADTQEWRAQIANDLPKWQGIVDYVNDNAATGAPEAFVLPAGQALGNLYDRIEAGEVPGITSIRDLFSDNIHLNDTGNWFIAALQASAVTGLDVSALPLETFDPWGGAYGGPDAALAQVMAEVIDDTLDEFLPQESEPPTDEIDDEDADDNTLNGGPWDDELAGGVGDDILLGGSGNDTLYGGDGNDSLTGGAGNDVIIGDGGDDVLTLGDGSDTVSGGDGDDVFVLTGLPGAVLITDFGANGAQDMIDLSAIDGYGRFADVAAAASFSGADTVLTFVVPDGVLTVTVQSDVPLTSDDFGLPADPNGPTEIVAPVDQVDPTGLTFTIEGADSHHFSIDPITGDISNMSWFDPSYDQVWDINGDRIYEVERVGSNADGEEVSRTSFELETTLDGVVWREVSDEDSNVDSIESMDDETTFSLEGPDAYHFVIDPDSGEIGNMSWFDPSYDQVWDTNGDRIYEVDRVETSVNGEEVSRTSFELETTLDGVVWREVSDEDDNVDPIEPIDDGRTFFLEGPDAYHFVIDPDSGEVGNASWFDPSYDRVWDVNGDRIYETERYALAEDGTEVSREALEMETTPDGVVWRVVPSSEDDEMSAAQIMKALALPPAEEKDLPPEPEESDEEAALGM